MTKDYLENIRDILSIMVDCERAKLSLENKAKIQVICEKYLESLLPQ